VGLLYPRVFNLPFTSARADLVGEHRIQSAYELYRGALAVGLDLARLGAFSASLTYELEVDRVNNYSSFASAFDVASAEQARLLSPQGVTTLHALRPALSLDLRDNVAHPRRGLFASATVELAHSLGQAGGHVLALLPGSETYINMVKAQYTLTGYLPLGRASVFALSLRGGRVFALDPNSVTIQPKRFYLGGAATMRGYGESEMLPEDRRDAAIQETRRCATLISGLGCSPELRDRLGRGIMLPSEGGQAYLLGKAELRIPLVQSLELGIFADVGNLWFDPGQVALRDVRLNAGVGLRLITPVGPAALDLGFNINPDSRLNETIMAPHFSIGFF
jgi:outer membrane protein insertion porin family